MSRPVQAISAATRLSRLLKCDEKVIAADNLETGFAHKSGNLGNGFLVRKVIETSRCVAGREMPLLIGKRRAGDPSRLVASSDKITRVLCFKPMRHELVTIIEAAWKWHRGHLDGYE